MNTNGTRARVLRILRDRYFPGHEPPQRLPRSRRAITPPILLPDSSDRGVGRASDESGIHNRDPHLGRHRISRICPFQCCRPECLPLGSTSEDGYGIDLRGNRDSTDTNDISGFHLFFHRKWWRSKLLARRDSDSRSPSTRHQPQHIRVLTRIVRAHRQSARCTNVITNRRGVYFSKDLRNRIGIAALLAREGVGGISEEKREPGIEDEKPKRHPGSQAQKICQAGAPTTLNA